MEPFLPGKATNPALQPADPASRRQRAMVSSAWMPARNRSRASGSEERTSLGAGSCSRPGKGSAAATRTVAGAAVEGAGACPAVTDPADGGKASGALLRRQGQVRGDKVPGAARRCLWHSPGRSVGVGGTGGACCPPLFDPLCAHHNRRRRDPAMRKISLDRVA